MKKLFFILVANSFALIANAQMQQALAEKNTTADDFNIVADLKTDSVAEVIENKSTRNKNRKSFFKKIRSTYEGFDVRNAWGLLSQKQ